MDIHRDVFTEHFLIKQMDDEQQKQLCSIIIFAETRF
jgi:hypothetical protein